MPTFLGNQRNVEIYGQPQSAFPSLGGLFDSLAKPFLDTASGDLKRAQTDLAGRKAQELAAAIGARSRLAELMRSGQLNPGDAAAEGVLADMKSDNLAGYDQYLTTKKFGAGSKEATDSYMAVPGANYGNTVSGVREDLANKRTLQDMQEKTKLRVEGQKPTTVLVDGVPTIVRQESSYGLPASVGLEEQKGAFARQALAKPGGVDTLTPASQKFIGAQPSGDDLINATLPDGTVVPARSTANGLVHAQTGQKLPDNIGPAGKLQATKAGDLSNTDSVVTGLVNSRINTQTAVSAIDKLSTDLSKPNADAASGWLGQGARIVNNVRSQVEAGARLVGGSSMADEIANPGIAATLRRVTLDPKLSTAAQRLGIQSATLQSQVSDLAYLIAKARDPQGRMSNQDVEKAAETVGSSLMDPVAARATLAEVKDGLLRQQAVRERVMGESYGKDFPLKLNTGVPAAPPTVIRFKRDQNNDLVRED